MSTFSQATDAGYCGEIEAARETAPTGAMVRVFCIPPQGQGGYAKRYPCPHAPYNAAIPLDEWDAYRAALDLPPGDYFASLHAPAEQRGRILAGSRFTVGGAAGPIPGSAAAPAAPDLAALIPAIAAARQPAETAADLVRRLDKLETMLTMSAQRPAAPTLNIQAIAALITALTPIIGPLLKRPDSLTDIVSTFRLLREDADVVASDGAPPADKAGAWERIIASTLPKILESLKPAPTPAPIPAYTTGGLPNVIAGTRAAGPPVRAAAPTLPGPGTPAGIDAPAPKPEAAPEPAAAEPDAWDELAARITAQDAAPEAVADWIYARIDGGALIQAAIARGISPLDFVDALRDDPDALPAIVTAADPRLTPHAGTIARIGAILQARFTQEADA